MPKYRFSSLGADGFVETSCILEVDTNDHACQIADQLLTEGDSEAIEVWNVLQLVYRTAKARAA